MLCAGARISYAQLLDHSFEEFLFLVQRLPAIS